MKRRDIVTALLLILAIGAVISPFASSRPDGFEKSADKLGIKESGESFHNAPMSDYTVPGIENPRTSTGVSGIAGIAVTFVFSISIGLVLRKMKAKRNG